MPETQSTRSPVSALRAAALIAAVVGAAGSLAFWVHAAKNPPLLVTVLFVIWVSGPFILLVLAHRLSPRWTQQTQTTLYVMMVIVTLATLAVYADEAVTHRWPHPAFVYTAVPPASVLLTAILLAAAALRSRERHSPASAR